MDSLFKEHLYIHCNNLIGDKISVIKQSLSDAQFAANNDTKSTAGDKHETSRAMAHLEIEKLSQQLNELNRLNELYLKLNLDHSPFCKPGSLVKTNKGYFFISVSLGKILFEDLEVFTISPVSPIGKLLLNKKEKESFSLNNTYYIIEKIL